MRKAFRKKALTAHPDKGGDAAGFLRLQQAATQLVGKQQASAQQALGATEPQTDFELREHRSMVDQLFARDGKDREQACARLAAVRAELGLTTDDLGARNTNEQGETMYNQCFYLSLARSYMQDGEQVAVKDTALHLKRVIEAEVLRAHPEWAAGRVGEDVQAFSDFLAYVLGEHALLSELCVAVFDSISGGVEVWKGAHYEEADARQSLLTIQYEPGHYVALVPQSRRPSLADLQKAFDNHEVLYVITNVAPEK